MSQGINLHNKRNYSIWLLASIAVFGTLDCLLISPAVAGRSPHISTPLTDSLSISASTTAGFEQGKQYYQQGQFKQAIQAWESALEGYKNTGDILKQIQTLNFLAATYLELGEVGIAEDAANKNAVLFQKLGESNTQINSLFAQSLNNQGMIALALGKTQESLLIWKEANALYAKNNDEFGVVTTNINQSQALQTLGQYRKAKDVLEKSVIQLQTQEDSILKVKSLESLGVALQNLGEPLESKQVLEESWKVSRAINSSSATSSVLFNLGNVAKDLEQYDVAAQYYQRSFELAANPIDQLDIQLNQLRLALQIKQFDQAGAIIPDIQNNLQLLSTSRQRIYTSINFAESLLQTSQVVDDGDRNLTAIADYQNPGLMIGVLTQAVRDAREIGDIRAEAYALQQLGKTYFTFNELSEAATITKKALDLAQSINTNDLTARTSSQLATIQKAQGNKTEAIATYELAFDQLQTLRRDLVAVNPDVQFEFKENIEPIYRSYVDLLLQPNASQADLQQARAVMEALQLAELDDYFRDACLDVYPVNLEEVDQQAAIIYPILLGDRLEIIVSLPDKTLKNFSAPVTRDQLEARLERFHSSFSPGFPGDRHRNYAKQFYDWLIQPIEAELRAADIQTLVFIPDSFLRNIPMAALYDGEQYLIEKYSIAISPGLQLFPQGINQQKLDVFAGGLSEARQGFESLPGLNKEIGLIAEQAKSLVLLNQNFTYDNLIETVNDQSFPVVHLATHGQFSSDPDRTFLLAWDQRISLESFDRLFEKRRLGILDPIELLVMSACQTAQGDNRAVLGLSGFALRSGAKSTLGSLWPVSDESTTELMIEFYDQLLNQNQSKAEALRQAQLKLLRDPTYEHPFFWSAFILVGNWL
ncbi:MAG: CHAT domain-containing protein [Limnothrix sp. RL_2_0]|nr:CHAT domain-containing protein [Limnothrix sp. RL_2_0]